MSSSLLVKSTRYLLFLLLLFTVLHFAKPFLVPVCFGALFSMLLLPLCERLEGKIGKVPAILTCVLSIVVAAAAIVALLSWQIVGIADDAAKMDQQINEAVNQVKQYISTAFGISPEKQQELLSKQQQQTSGMAAKVAGFVTGTMALLGNAILVLVYIFLFLFARKRLKAFVLKLVPQEAQENARTIIDKSRKVTQQYLSGLSLMIICLWVLYSIGFSIAGVRNPIFFAVLCGLLELVPFVGNLTGSILTALMAIAQGGGAPVVVGVTITYVVVQLFQSYVLEPIVVGSNVNLNPLFTILIIVVGEQVWGVPGMILAIPLLGIFKIICDHVPALHPYGYLIGEDKQKSVNWLQKLKRALKK